MCPHPRLRTGHPCQDSIASCDVAGNAMPDAAKKRRYLCYVCPRSHQKFRRYDRQLVDNAQDHPGTHLREVVKCKVKPVAGPVIATQRRNLENRHGRAAALDLDGAETGITTGVMVMHS